MENRRLVAVGSGEWLHHYVSRLNIMQGLPREGGEGEEYSPGFPQGRGGGGVYTAGAQPGPRLSW
jgi:hypothetical protein